MRECVLFIVHAGDSACFGFSEVKLFQLFQSTYLPQTALYRLSLTIVCNASVGKNKQGLGGEVLNGFLVSETIFARLSYVTLVAMTALCSFLDAFFDDSLLSVAN